MQRPPALATAATGTAVTYAEMMAKPIFADALVRSPPRPPPGQVAPHAPHDPTARTVGWTCTCNGAPA
eukprot:5142263-Alexandrium_andersonii.AAC.1